jgi:hypothetical protein
MVDDHGRGRLYWGLGLIIVGIAVLLSSMGYLPPILWEQWWPILLIVLGGIFIVRQFSSSAAHRERPTDSHPLEASTSLDVHRTRERPRVSSAGVILIGLGVAFLLRGVLGVAVVPAVVLIAIGLAIILR